VHSATNKLSRGANNVNCVQLCSVFSLLRSAAPVTPVRKVDAITGFHLRRWNVAQFVIVYVYFDTCLPAVGTRQP
jgi:hypothetical protein